MKAVDFDLLVVGELNPDLILAGDDLSPTFGQAEKLVAGATLTVGSSSAIVACGAARLGLRTAFIGMVGDDLFGRFMLDELQGRGIDTGGCVVSGRPTAISVVLSQPSDRAILTYLGSTAALRFGDIDLDYLQRSRHLHVSSYFLLDGLRAELPRLFGHAKGLGLGTSLDTNFDPRGEWDGGLPATLEHVDVLLPNEAEALQLGGTTDLDAALDTLSKSVATVAVKCGARGGKVRHRGSTVSAPALTVAAIDTTGAGDSFNAGLLYGVINGWTPSESLRLACACGSLSTRAVGGVGGQATLAEARAALGEGWRDRRREEDVCVEE